jgi:hypothetical protein
VEERIGEGGSSISLLILVYKYSICQYRFERDLEVIGGAGVRGGRRRN